MDWYARHIADRGMNFGSINVADEELSLTSLNKELYFRGVASKKELGVPDAKGYFR